MRIAKIKIVAAVGRPPDLKKRECRFLPKAATTVLGKPLILIFQQTCAIQNRHKIFFDFGETFSGDGIPGDQDDFDRRGKFILMLPETFAQQPSGAAALHGAAEAFARDDA